MPAVLNNTIKELVDAANDVRDAAKAMNNCKDASSRISKLALEIATSIENTAAAARHRGEDTNATGSVNAALGVARDVFIQCSGFMRDVAGKGPITRHFKQGLTADTIGGYLASIEGLHELLKIQDHSCKLMIEPFAGIGVDEACSKGILTANIKTTDAAYDGLKSTVAVMVNMTDGLPWPLKAAPQTFLYVLQLLESFQGIRPKITSLLFSIQNLWKAVEQVSPEAVAKNMHLQDHLYIFFEILQRIAIRLHIVLGVGKVKRTMAIHTVTACLVLEEQRLAEAGKTIQSVFSVQIMNTVTRLESGIARLQPPASASPDSPLEIDISISTALPARPIVFHGRDEFVSNSVRLLTASGSARLAILGPGGMGKTTIALAILYKTCVVEHLQDRRFFLSCEALVDANSVVISLAKLLGLPASRDLLSAVITRLTEEPRALLVLDNLETVWLADGGPVVAVEELLGRLAQIPSLSIIITCRGIILPQLVDWSNPDTATLEPFSLEAALETFEDRAGFHLAGVNEDIARQLLTAVDCMPLAVTLLGQLARRGAPVSELLDRWNREHSALLRTHNNGRINNAEVSVKLSITMASSADDSGESLQLLSVCCLLPDGLRPDVFNRMRAYFKHIDRARDTLTAYALASLDGDRVLKTLSPIRHVVLENYPAQSSHRDALHAIYFEIADRLPVGVNETFRELVAEAAPEMGNLSSLLLALVSEPSQQIVDAVVQLTDSAAFHQPTVTIASALLPQLQSHPHWKVNCLRAISSGYSALGDYPSAIEAANTAAQLYLEFGNRSLAARCKIAAGRVYRLIGDFDQAELLLEDARDMLTELGDEFDEAESRHELARVMRMRGNHSGAIEHLMAVRATFVSLGCKVGAAGCTLSLGTVYIDQGEISAAIVESQSARSAFIDLGYQNSIAQSTLVLGNALRKQGNLALAEQYLQEVQSLCRMSGDRFGLASCAEVFGYIRWQQQREEEALVQLELAHRLYESLQVRDQAEHCQRCIKSLESIIHPTP